MSASQDNPSQGADLDDWEVDHACDGYVQNAARVRFLRSLGLTVRQKPNGRPLVNRAHYDAVMAEREAQKQPTGRGKAPSGINWRVPG